MSAAAPQPPSDLHRRELIIEPLPTGTPLYRFYSKINSPTYFDKSQGSRFNSPDSRYGVLYAALGQGAAFAETFLRNLGSTSISQRFIEEKACAIYTLARPLRAVRLRGYGLAPIGATASVCSCPGPPYPIPQAWSSALYDHPERPDAILYGSRHNDEELCLAVFDRAADALGVPTGVPNLLDELWFFDLINLNRMAYEA